MDLQYSLHWWLALCRRIFIGHTCALALFTPLVAGPLQVLDRATCKLVASEYNVLVVDKEEADKVGLNKPNN